MLNYSTKYKSRHDLKAEFAEECNEETTIYLIDPNCPMELAVDILLASGRANNPLYATVRSTEHFELIVTKLPGFANIIYDFVYSRSHCEEIFKALSNYPPTVLRRVKFDLSHYVHFFMLPPPIPFGLNFFHFSVARINSEELDLFAQNVDRAAVRILCLNRDSYETASVAKLFHQLPHLRSFMLNGSYNIKPYASQVMAVVHCLNMGMDLARRMLLL